VLAKQYLSELYPSISSDDLQDLLDSPIVRMSPGDNLLPIGKVQESIYLILRGYVDLRDEHHHTQVTFSAGTIAGELAALLSKPAFYDHIATSYVYALKIPANLYRKIAAKNHLHSDIASTQEKRLFLLSCGLFEHGISYATLNHLVHSLQSIELQKGSHLDLKDHRWIYLIKTGEADLYRGEQLLKSVGPNEMFGEEAIFAEQSHIYHISPRVNMMCYRIDSSLLSRIPVCRWKLLQSLRRDNSCP
jgi:hemerythrin